MGSEFFLEITDQRSNLRIYSCKMAKPGMFDNVDAKVIETKLYPKAF